MKRILGPEGRVMAEGTEFEERLDFDEDNSMEEMDDDIEEQIDDDVEAQIDDDVEAEHKDSITEISGKDQEADRSHIASEFVEDEEKPASSVDEDEKEKHAELLALPPHGSEVFIGGLPRDAIEEDLRHLCEPIGEFVEVRLIKDKETGDAKGYAFIAFKTKEVAQKAIEEIHNKEFKGKNLRCSLSETKHRLFLGNVPKSWTEDEFRKVIEGVGPGVESIELIKDPQNPSRNRGYAFVLYYNNACANYSRQNMSNANFKLDGNTPTVTWADPKSGPDHSAASQVKALYVKNIPENTSTEKLKELFQHHGELKKVVMPPGKAGGKRDFGFIHYAERSSALKAVKDAEKYEIDGQVLDVALAKPQSDKKSDATYPYNVMPHPNHLSHSGYGGFSSNQYASIGAGYGVGTGFQQPGAQIPPPRPRRIDRSNAQSPSGPPARPRGSGNDEGNRGRRYRPY
ncbi:hypothetical protein I3760_01G076500 [Carya illinoinensis]|nr:hypothetical protein I3760_01G076500 [Carya illinoinensis]